ncbi:uncharacterized protein Dvar_33020 [Desulfosarcina variabilis str. Montpellier]
MRQMGCASCLLPMTIQYASVCEDKWISDICVCESKNGYGVVSFLQDEKLNGFVC